VQRIVLAPASNFEIVDLAQHRTVWQRQQRLRDQDLFVPEAHTLLGPGADAISAALLLFRHVPGELARGRAGSCAPCH
jgi:hypothetical protein